MATKWVLVGDSSRARIFADLDDSGSFEVLRELEHPESRARARDLMADANGRKPVGPSVGANYGGRSVSLGVGRVGVAPDTDPKDVESQKFARELADALQEGLEHDAYASLVIVAPPHFLGLLRAMLSDEVGKRVEHSLDKDLTKLPAREIQARLRDQLSPPP